MEWDTYYHSVAIGVGKQLCVGNNISEYSNMLEILDNTEN